jgi:hypothetical protein
MTIVRAMDAALKTAPFESSGDNKKNPREQARAKRGATDLGLLVNILDPRGNALLVRETRSIVASRVSWRFEEWKSIGSEAHCCDAATWRRILLVAWSFLRTLRGSGQNQWT